MVSVITEINSSNLESVINKIQNVCRSEPNLSPRPKNQLISAYQQSRLLLAMNNSSLVGWILRLPYANKSQELAAAYVEDAHRSNGIFTKLLREAIKEADISIIVTFNKRLANYLLNKRGFKKSSLWEVVKISNGQFLIERLKLERLFAIFNNYKRSSPTYLIFEKNG